MMQGIRLFGIATAIIMISCQSTTSELTTRLDKSFQMPDSIVTLSNQTISLAIDQYGGAFYDVSLKANPINPLTWALTSEQMPPNNQAGAPFKGHFLCLGRWGSPSEEEIEAGIPHNGEQSNTFWTIKDLTENTVLMENEAPLDGLSVTRDVALVGETGFLTKETFTNTYSLGRVSNVVQHVTLGPPFLNSQTLINSNAKQGFNQSGSYPDPHKNEFMWPIAFLDSLGNTTDERSTATPDNYCMTHIFEMSDIYGWVTAYDPISGVVLGYVWKLEEYPWINIWSHQTENGPFAKGIEFGTTGIGRKYKDLLAVDTRFYGRNSWEYIEAGEILEKSFIGFMVDLGKDLDNPIVSINADAILINNKHIMENPL